MPDRRSSIRIGGSNQATVFLEEVASGAVVSKIPASVDDISFSGIKVSMTPDTEARQHLKRKDLRVRVELSSHGQPLSVLCVLRRTEEAANRVSCGLVYGNVEAQTIMKMVEAVYGSEPRPRVKVVYWLIGLAAILSLALTAAICSR